MPVTPFSDLSAIERATALVDRGTLALSAHDGDQRSSLIAGRGRIGGRDTVLVLTDGQQRGGTVGMVEARQISAALGAAARRGSALVVCWDTGGVRVQEGPAALAAMSAVGVALAELALRGAPVVSVVCGRRGCFGAPSVVAALGQATLQTADALWGLTGPQLIERGAEAAEAARKTMSAAARRRGGHVTVVADSAAALRRVVGRMIARPLQRVSGRQILQDCAQRTTTLVERLAPASAAPVAAKRRRDFFSYSLRRQWRPVGPAVRIDHVHAVWGELAGKPVMAIIIGPDRSHDGVGVADAHAVLQAVQIAAAASPRRAPAPIVTFLFCRGHAVSLRDERAGLPSALADCLRGLVTARLLGHPLICVLGGGAYGAAYLALAAPSHRILALRGTSVAPMAPRVLAAFQRLRGIRHAADTPPDLARMIPQIRIVDSVVRLPRALADELAVARRAAAQEPHPHRFARVP